MDIIHNNIYCRPIIWAIYLFIFSIPGLGKSTCFQHINVTNGASFKEHSTLMSVGVVSVRVCIGWGTGGCVGVGGVGAFWWQCFLLFRPTSFSYKPVATLLVSLHFSFRPMSNQKVVAILNYHDCVFSKCFAGEILNRHLTDVLPFGNSATAFNIYGENITAMLEHSIHNYPVSGAFLQMSGKEQKAVCELMCIYKAKQTLPLNVQFNLKTHPC